MEEFRVDPRVTTPEAQAMYIVGGNPAKLIKMIDGQKAKQEG